MSNRSTISDVADAAGVSKATVSRVLNDTSPHIRAETRKRVMQAVSDLQYRPNSIARSMTIKRTSAIGLLVSDVGNPFYADVVNGVEDFAFEASYDIFICNVRFDIERGTRFIRSLIDRNVDGIIFMSTLMSEAWLDEIAQSDIPAVLVDSQIKKEGAPIGLLDVDFQTGIAEMVDHFWQLGHRHYAHISGPLNWLTANKRWQAYADALAQYGIPKEDILFIEGNLQMDSGRDALTTIMNATPRPTAVFAANDLVAIGLLTEAGRQDMHIPQDFSLCGLDNIWLASEVDLSTVSLQPYQLGQQAIGMLMDHLDEKHLLDNHRQQRHSHLIVRDSMAPPSNE